MGNFRVALRVLVTFKRLGYLKLSRLVEQLNTVWVSCEGENPADIENVGPIKYYPRRGFPGYFYPFENSEGYLSPLVAVHFERPVRK